MINITAIVVLILMVTTCHADSAVRGGSLGCTETVVRLDPSKAESREWKLHSSSE